MIHTLTEKAICIDTHDDLIEFELTHDGKKIVAWDADGCSGYLVDNLPEGNWGILGRASQLTKEKWKQVVEGYIYSGKISFQAYRNYVKPVAESMEDIIADPVESGISLLESKGIEFPSSVIILIKKQ